MTNGKSRNERDLNGKGFGSKPQGHEAKKALADLSPAQMEILVAILGDIKKRAPDQDTEAAVNAVGGHNW